MGIASGAGLMYLEQTLFRINYPMIYEKHFMGLDMSFSGVIFINIIFSGLLMVYLGMAVAGARKKYAAKAKADGDEHAEARFAYPKLYAEGFSEHAKNFNCVQRGHQQALETYTMYIVLSLIGGLTFPISVTAAGLIWSISRLQWAQGYATGDPSKRYNNTGRGVWISLIIVLLTGIATSLKVAGNL